LTRFDREISPKLWLTSSLQIVLLVSSLALRFNSQTCLLYSEKILSEYLIPSARLTTLFISSWSERHPLSSQPSSPLLPLPTALRSLGLHYLSMQPHDHSSVGWRVRSTSGHITCQEGHIPCIQNRSSVAFLPCAQCVWPCRERRRHTFRNEAERSHRNSLLTSLSRWFAVGVSQCP
jgi:hypothetical protein